MDVRIDGVRYVPVPFLAPTQASLALMLRNYREINRLTLEEASQQAGVSKTYLWELERGEAVDPSFAIVVRLARLYGANLESLAAAI